MLKCVLFDFDGVVVQSELLHKKTFMEVLAPFGVDVGVERWYKEFAGTGSRHIFEVLVKENNIDMDLDKLVEKRKMIYESCVRAGELKVTPGAEDFINSLKSFSVKCAIVSGSHKSNVDLALEMLHLEECFDLVISGDEMARRKPDPEPFLNAAWKLGFAPVECAVIEDSVSGCKAARAAGMKLIVMESPALPFVGQYDMAIKDFQGLDYQAVAKLFE